MLRGSWLIALRGWRTARLMPMSTPVPDEPVRPLTDVGRLAATIDDVARLTGTFTLRSGRVAHEYFDKYRFEAVPELLHAIAGAMIPLIPAGTQALAGLELGGVPIATALSLRTGLPVAFVRKEPKTYGTAKLAEGADLDGVRVLVVEDVITTGGQVVISTDQLRQLGAVIDTVVCVIDRSDPPGSGAAALAASGLTLRSVLTKHDLDTARSRSS